LQANGFLGRPCDRRCRADACAGTQGNGYKGSIFMVFEYMHHDLTGYMERVNYKLTPAQV
jgi:hypothetical protein